VVCDFGFRVFKTKRIFVPSMKRTCTIRAPESERVIQFQAPVWSVAPTQQSYGHWSERLVSMKTKLDTEPYHSEWVHFKEYTNKYERVFTANSHNGLKKSVAQYVPVSRSYFKLWEMMHDFPLLDNTCVDSAVQTAHLAEGPGGFIEAVCRFRNHQDTTKDAYYGMTLIDKTNKEVPDWSKARKLMLTYPQIRLHHGVDHTGNLYKIDNIHALVEAAGRHSCDLVTGDGGIDYSQNYAQQEEMSQRLLVSQVYAGLLLVKPSKHFVCKLFDTNVLFTQEILWILSVVFDTVHLVKPLTSRAANSERYIVACGFRGCSVETEIYIRELLQNWHPQRHIQKILHQSLPPVFVQALYRYNEWHASQQYTSLKRCYQLIDEFASPHTKQTKHKMQIVLADIKKQQEQFARLWCLKYKVNAM